MNDPGLIDDRPFPALMAFYATRLTRTPLEAALVYASRGWFVFPLYWVEEGRCMCDEPNCQSPGKHPLRYLVPHGFKQASVDESVIGRWWSRYPDANVGIRTGAVSKLIVLDIDADKGGESSLTQLEERTGKIRTCQRVATGSGGMHLYLAHPGDGRVFKNSASKLGPGLDVRADGGYVVAPPSRNLRGKYAWL